MYTVTRDNDKFERDFGLRDQIRRAAVSIPSNIAEGDELDSDKQAQGLYREGKISLGKAKELAGFENKWEMIRLLNERGVDLRYSAKDAKADLETLNRVVP